MVCCKKGRSGKRGRSGKKSGTPGWWAKLVVRVRRLGRREADSEPIRPHVHELPSPASETDYYDGGRSALNTATDTTELGAATSIRTNTATATGPTGPSAALPDHLRAGTRRKKGKPALLLRPALPAAAKAEPVDASVRRNRSVLLVTNSADFDSAPTPAN